MKPTAKGSYIHVPAVEPCGVCTTKVCNDCCKGCVALGRVPRLSTRIEIGQDLERQVLTERMDRYDHISTFLGASRWSVQTILEGIVAEQVQDEFVHP